MSDPLKDYIIARKVGDAVDTYQKNHPEQTFTPQEIINLTRDTETYEKDMGRPASQDEIINNGIAVMVHNRGTDPKQDASGPDKGMQVAQGAANGAGSAAAGRALASARAVGKKAIGPAGAALIGAYDVYQDIQQDQPAEVVAEDAGCTVGSVLVGAAGGAVGGSILPVGGTLVGGIVGGVIGCLSVGAVAREIAKPSQPQPVAPQPQPQAPRIGLT
jgi:hypothetical protein